MSFYGNIVCAFRKVFFKNKNSNDIKVIDSSLDNQVNIEAGNELIEFESDSNEPNSIKVYIRLRWEPIITT